MSDLARVIITDSMVNTHCHLREGDVSNELVADAFRGGADTLLPMPNTQSGLLNMTQVSMYIASLIEGTWASIAGGVNFIPTVLINEHTTESMIDECVNNDISNGKLYPFNRTTNSEIHGVRHYGRLMQIVKHCGKVGMRLHLHPEHPWMLFDSRDAEYQFLPLVDMFLNESEVEIVWEHGTDARCVPFWKEMAESGRFFVTLTAHHLATDEDSTFGDVRAVCKPPIKTRRDRLELVRLVGEDYRWVMAGLDDAPHDRSSKHVHKEKCACGAYTAPFGLPLYAHALNGLLRRPNGVTIFQNFTSRNARKLYKLSPAFRRIKLTNWSYEIPSHYCAGRWEIEPFWAGHKISWTLE